MVMYCNGNGVNEWNEKHDVADGVGECNDRNVNSNMNSIIIDINNNDRPND